jgi:hypothetical protein
MTGHFTSYENRTDHELATQPHGVLRNQVTPLNLTTPCM